MHTQTFTYTPSKIGELMLVRIDRDDKFHHVTIGDTYLGTMVEDENAEYGWQSDDQLLLDELPELSMALKEEKAMFNLPYALKKIFPNELIGWEWNDDDLSLKLIANAETDLHEFGGVIRDQIYEVVLFDKDLIIYLVQEGSDNIEEIHVNC